MKIWVKVLIIFIVLFIVLFVVAPMICTIVLYNNNFAIHVDSKQNTFKEADFSMQIEEISFSSNDGQILRGFIYRKDNSYSPKALIVFSTGYLNTHNDYLNQIDFFVQNDFIVLAYDNTGSRNK